MSGRPGAGPLVALAVGAALAACGRRAAEPSPGPGPGAQPAAATAPTPRPEPAATPAASAAAPAPLPAQGSLVHPTQASRDAARTPAPPQEKGASRTEVQGCLAVASEAEAAGFPAPPVTRAPGPPPVRVSPVTGGVLVEHTLTHACCLKAVVTSHAEQGTATVSEALVGNPCRCRCGSTVRTAVALPPGRWTVALDLTDSGGTRRVSEDSVEVR